ncbi:putative disease resistance RPP13-like protein 1 [Citrus sinensis]|nr:putative disease resistance RPP13-like protein 1 [Citrus sinensis]
MAVGGLFLSAFLQMLFDRLMSREVLNFARREGVISKLEKWKKTLLMIQAVFSDAEEKQLTDKAVKMWLDDLQDLAYDVEDILDEFATEALARKLKVEHHQSSSSNSKVQNLIIPACFTSLSPSSIKFNVGMGSKIRSISSRFEEICKQKVELGLQMNAGGVSIAGWQRPTSTCLPTEPAVFGRDEDKAKILEMVLRDEPTDANFSLIPIVGMAGVGKTTLARVAFDDKAVEMFNLRSWVCVSDDFDILRITKSILESITFSPNSLKDLNQIQVQLREAVAGKRFLIVLDDVWSKNYSLWNTLKSPFRAGASGSKILVTTRSTDVALTVGTAEYYNLKLLSDDDCWSVFVKHAFEKRDVGLHRHMGSIRKKVVQKCRGLPLAAETLGGLLRCKQSDDEWDEILNSKIWSIFQPSSNNSFKFIMHDLVNDLAQWISGETSFRLENEMVTDNKSRRFRRARHSSYTCGFYDGKSKFEVFHEVEHLRTFLLVLSYEIRLLTRYITDVVLSNLLPKFTKLRVLSLKKYYITELPHSIGDLKHLRYINLSETMIRCLPESICSLCNLQFLILRGCYRLKKLPSNLRNLINLRHLVVTYVDLIREMPLGIKELKCLQMLSNFIVGMVTGSRLKDLKDFKLLRGELCISRLDYFDDSRNEALEKNVLDMLQPHRSLKELTVKCYGGTVFPSWMGDPLFSNIVLLRLEDCEKCTSLPSLGLLGSLKNLTIKGMRRLKSIGFEIYGEGCSKPFQALETLCFEDLPEWEHWNSFKENDHVERFACLRQLSIVKCPRLCGRLPNHLPILEKLMIYECVQLVVSFSSLPLLCKLEIDRCKGVACRSPADLMSINSDSFKYFRNEICLEKPPIRLQSLSSLQKLSIEDCPTLISFPESCFPSILSELKIRNCNALTSLPVEMKHDNACLKSLWVGGCHSLTYIIRGHLPSSLKILQIRNCRKLQCLLHDEEETSIPSSLMMHGKNNSTSTSLLQSLYVYNCPSLICLSSKGQLPKALQQLEILDCPKLESIAERFHNNTSLGCIWIWKCENLKSLPEGLPNLNSLHNIYVWDCPSLVSFPEGGLPNCSLSVTIGFPSYLTSLSIEDLNAYESPIDWGLHKLTSLKILCVIGCPDAVSFPEEEIGMTFPSSLTELVIDGYLGYMRHRRVYAGKTTGVFDPFLVNAGLVRERRAIPTPVVQATVDNTNLPEKQRTIDMDVSRKDASREDNEAGETITFREITNEARERMMQDRLEWMEKQMETLANILHELRDERRRNCETPVGRDDVGAEPSLRRRRVEEIPPSADQPNGVYPHGSTSQVSGGRIDEGRDQPLPGRVLEVNGRGGSVDEGELRQRLHNAELERDQIATRDPDCAVELEGEVRRLAQVMEEIQDKRKPPNWRIMLDEESPLSTEIMSTVIPRDFSFPDLKYSCRSDPLVHIERFNDMTRVQGLTPAQRCRVFPLTLEGRA